METIEELEAKLVILEKELELVALEKELAKEEKIIEKKEKEINSNPEMAKLVKEQRELKEEKSVVEKRKEKLEIKIKEQFIAIDEHSMSRYPQFQHKTSEWDEETNIFDDVLDEIRQHSSLHLLRNGDVEDAVRMLINKAFSECSELVELKNRYEFLSTRIRELWEEEHDLDKKLREGFQSKVYDLRQKISKIKQQIANPKKYIEQQKRENKRDEARNKLKDPKILDAIYKKLDIEIPKGKSKVKVKE